MVFTQTTLLLRLAISQENLPLCPQLRKKWPDQLSALLVCGQATKTLQLQQFGVLRYFVFLMIIFHRSLFRTGGRRSCVSMLDEIIIHMGAAFI